MFSFVFKIKSKPIDWEITINGHEIKCSKKNASFISPKIQQIISTQKCNEKDESDSFSITIPDFENSLIFSEFDYKYFEDIFNLVPIQISTTNKDFLKIFAREFEIEELSSLIAMFEESNEIITHDHILLIQKEIMEKIIDINDDNFEQLIFDLSKIKEENEEVNNEFLYYIFLTACLVRSEKIELLLKFLKEFENQTNGSQFQYFKDLILNELRDNEASCEMRFIIRYLYTNKEITEEKIRSTLKKNDSFIFKDIIYDKEIEELKYFQKFNYAINNPLRDQSLSTDNLIEYAKTGSNPNKIFQAIRNDDLDLFSQLTNENLEKSKYNNFTYSNIYERNSDLYDTELNYLDLCAFFGSEKIFNFILMNDKEISASDDIIILAVCGGNSTIISKYSETLKLNQSVLFECLMKSIQYHRYEVFEWLIETFEPFKEKKQTIVLNIWPFSNMKIDDISDLLEQSIRYNNFEAFNYLFSIGIDYQPLFSLAMLYNNFYLAHLSLKLPYDCKCSSKKIQFKNNSPFLYMHHNISLFIILTRSSNFHRYL